MSWRPFETVVSGKWVLAGEHSVLRGATAIALPLPDFTTKLRFAPSTQGRLLVEPNGSVALVNEILSDALQLLRGPVSDHSSPSGVVHLESTIPPGAGLGSSAALCVALTQWIGSALEVPESRWPETARNLENRFHGRSSGMDVSVILAREPIAFTMENGAEHLRLKALPRFSFHDTGLRAKTSDCIAKVSDLARTHPETAARHDHHMAEAARLARQGLELYAEVPKMAIEQLAQAMTLAQTCYRGWGLVPAEVGELEHKLLEEGALACKLTGAGGGGFLVALWPVKR